MGSTSINISEDIGQLSGLLLNISELERNTEYTRIAYCSKVDIGTTIDSKTFFRFNIVDNSGHTIQARLFNVEDVDNKGAVANNLKNKLVKIRFSVSSFNGSETLNIYSIDVVPENALSKEEFIGDIPGIKEDYEYVTNEANKLCSSFPIIGSLISKYSLLHGAETVTMPDMWAERKGGAVKFTAKLLKMVEGSFDSDVAYAKAIVILSELFMYWKYASDYEEDVLSLGDNVNNILAKSDKYLDAVMNKAKQVDNKCEYNLCKETKHLLKCYFGYIEPETYLTMSINSLRESLMFKLKLEEEDKSMLYGTYKNVYLKDGSLKRIVKLESR